MARQYPLPRERPDAETGAGQSVREVCNGGARGAHLRHQHLPDVAGALALFRAGSVGPVPRGGHQWPLPTRWWAHSGRQPSGLHAQNGRSLPGDSHGTQHQRNFGARAALEAARAAAAGEEIASRGYADKRPVCVPRLRGQPLSHWRRLTQGLSVRFAFE